MGKTFAIAAGCAVMCMGSLALGMALGVASVEEAPKVAAFFKSDMIGIIIVAIAFIFAPPLAYWHEQDMQQQAVIETSAEEEEADVVS